MLELFHEHFMNFFLKEEKLSLPRLFKKRILIRFLISDGGSPRAGNRNCDTTGWTIGDQAVRITGTGGSEPFYNILIR